MNLVITVMQAITHKGGMQQYDKHSKDDRLFGKTQKYCQG